MLTICDYSNKKSVMAKFMRSFEEGVGSVVSLRGGYIKKPKGSLDSDAEQLRQDWAHIGSFIQSAYEHESKNVYPLIEL